MNVISIIIFLSAIAGIMLTKKNIILILIAIELLLLSVNINLVFASLAMNDILGQIFVLIILTLAAAETSLGLAILVVFYRLRGIISSDSLTYIKY